jgi:cytochrome P450
MASLADLEHDPHATLARLRRQSPVAWVPALDGWLVTGYAEAVAVMRDSGTFTVDDPRFSTARVVGPSMLSLDGPAHSRHRAPFFGAFHRGGAAQRLPAFADTQAHRLVEAICPAGAADLRAEVSGPLAVAVVAEALGLGDVSPAEILALYTRIVGGVTSLSGEQARAAAAPGARSEERATREGAASKRPGASGPAPQDTTGIGAPSSDEAGAFTALAGLLRAVIEAPGAAGRSVLGAAAAAGHLSTDEIISDAAVVMFGGIDTTDGMIANAALHLLSHPGQLELVRSDPALLPAAAEESLRLEPAAAIVDRYATRDTTVAGAGIRAGDRVTVSISGANRDPAVFTDPDRFDLSRPESGRHLAFAHGPHFCIGAPAARAETLAALRALLSLPGLRLDPAQVAEPRGLVFRKPPTLRVLWD